MPRSVCPDSSRGCAHVRIRTRTRTRTSPPIVPDNGGCPTTLSVMPGAARRRDAVSDFFSHPRTPGTSTLFSRLPVNERRKGARAERPVGRQDEITFFRFETMTSTTRVPCFATSTGQWLVNETSARAADR